MQEHFIQFLERNRQISSVNRNDPSRITFERGGLTFIFDWDNDDPGFFSLSLPNIDDYNIRNVDTILNLQRDFKVAKCIIINDQLWLGIQMIVTNFENIDSLFFRSIVILTQMRDSYIHMRQNEQNH